MSLYGGSGKFEQAPEGPCVLVISDIVDLGMKESTFKGEKKIKHKFAVRAFLNKETKEGKLHRISQWLTLSSHKRSKARQLIEQAFGKKIEKLDGWDPEAKRYDYENPEFLGQSFQGMIVHNDEYANLGALMPLAEGMKAIEVPDDYVREIDRPADESQDVRKAESDSDSFEYGDNAGDETVQPESTDDAPGPEDPGY